MAKVLKKDLESEVIHLTAANARQESMLNSGSNRELALELKLKEAARRIDNCKEARINLENKVKEGSKSMMDSHTRFHEYMEEQPLERVRAILDGMVKSEKPRVSKMCKHIMWILDGSEP